jgi:hypothetical protein
MKKEVGVSGRFLKQHNHGKVGAVDGKVGAVTAVGQPSNHHVFL